MAGPSKFRGQDNFDIYGRGKPMHEAVFARTHGYCSPRDHFVYGPPAVTLDEIAVQWNVPQQILTEWARKFEWDAMRAAHQEKVSAGGSAQLAVATPADPMELARADLLKQELDAYDRLRTIAMERLNRNALDKDAKDFNAESNVLMKAFMQLRTALGLPNKIALARRDGMDVRNVAQINIVTQRGKKETFLAVEPSTEVLDGTVVEPSMPGMPGR